MTRALLAAPILLAMVLISACAAAPRPQAEVQVQPAADETAEPLPDGIVPLTREQDERLSQ